MQDSSSCSNDSVTLKDTATGIELFTLCGNKLPDDVMSLSNKMTVVFASDRSVTKSGFVISYVASRKVFGKQYVHFHGARCFFGFLAISEIRIIIYNRPHIFAKKTKYLYLLRIVDQLLPLSSAPVF